MKAATIITLTLALAACGGSGSPTTTQTPVTVAPPATEHLITYGQSLSLGANASDDLAACTSAATYNNVGLMFKGGTRPTDLTELVPFDESTGWMIPGGGIDDPVFNINCGGETPLYGALNAIKTLDQAFHVGSAAGRGGTSIANLSKGTEPYARVIAQVTEAKKLSPGAYSVLGVVWLQGEADGGNTNYENELVQLVTDIEADIKAITGQSSVQFYICTTEGQDIANQQRAVAAAMSNVHIACDDRNYPKSDGIHLTADGSRQVGVAVGNAIIKQAE